MPSGLSFGAVILPLSIILLLLKQKGPVRLFIQAGAVSPETARKPGTVNVTGPELMHLPGLTRRGVLVSMDDGRYYVNLPIYRRRRRRLVMLLCGLCVAGIVAGVWMVERLH